MSSRSVCAALLAAVFALPAHAAAPTYDYVLGWDTDGQPIYGGSHRVVDLRGYRDAIDSANEPSRLHPELRTRMKYDATLTSGSSDWEVFASSWWPQSKNGVARRWTDSDSVAYGDLSDRDDLSPAEKYDLVFNPGQTRTVASVEHWNYSELDTPEADRGPKHSHPAITVAGPVTKWELEEHGVYQTWSHPDSWWGHCNGWSSYATAEVGGAPQRDIRVKVVGGDVVECAAAESGCTLFRMGDIEALMTEVYFDDSATFAGSRCDTTPEDLDFDADGRPTDPACRDLNPGSFHVAVTQLLGNGAEHLASGQQGHPAFVIDHNYDYQVWNFPVAAFEMTDQEEITEAQATALVGAGTDYQWNTAATRFVRVALTYSMVSDSVGNQAMLLRADQRGVPLHDVDLNYVLELASDGTILGGEWIEDPSTSWGPDNKKAHPDFMWMATDPQGYWENTDDLGGDSDNPYLSYTDVKALLDCANDPATCDGSGGSDTADPVDPGDGNDPGTTAPLPDCNAGCSRVGGPGPFAHTSLFGLLGLFVRRRRWSLAGLR